MNLDGARRLIARTCPVFDDKIVDQTIEICVKNEGLCFAPVDDPEYLFGFWRFHPELIQAVFEQNYDVLMNVDLRTGPLVYIAAFIAPVDGYHIIRSVADTIEDVKGFAFHRYNRRLQTWRFNLIPNTRRKVMIQ